jgi:hypothetical protein
MADYRAQRLAKILADYERFTAQSNPMAENNITPPSELIKQWTEPLGYKVTPGWLNEVIQKAIQYGADQELDSCCAWLLEEPLCESKTHRRLRAARRPKPPTLKEQALDELHISFDRGYLKEGAADTIRRALESINE